VTRPLVSRVKECDGEGDGLLLVEQQRGQFRAGVEPVSAVGPEYAQRLAHVTMPYPDIAT
jgi:hypothetical protein